MKRIGSRQFIEQVRSDDSPGIKRTVHQSSEEEEQIKRIGSQRMFECIVAQSSSNSTIRKIDTVKFLGTRWSKEKLRCFWMKTIIVSDTQLGRDKSARFFQYLGRMVSGCTGSTGIPWQLCLNLALMRRCLRFWKPVKLGKQIEDTIKDQEMPMLSKFLTVAEFSSFLMYCLMDHVRFAQNCLLLKLTPERFDLLDRCTEMFWVCETVPALMRESMVLFGRNRSSAERRLSRKWVVKLVCDLFVAVYFTWPMRSRNKRVHKIWSGLLGAFASLLSLHIAWPDDKIVDSP